MGLVDLRQSSGDRGTGAEVTRPSPSPTIPLRKKGTFDIAFLTGRSEEDEGHRQAEEHEERSSYSGRSSPSGGSSDSSIIDILSEPTNVAVASPPSSNQNRKRKSSEREPRQKSPCPGSGGDVLVPKLTTPFNFLPQFKGPLTPSMVHFGSFPPQSSPMSPGKVRRGFYGLGHPSSATSTETPPVVTSPQFYPPYHPFLIGPPPPPTLPEPANRSPPHNPPTLLPPSLAALSLPAQNVCAKCKIGFRMTSDLVYHMRSHHKRETDPQQKKREEKLKCPVCHETFRERHHLTRHMTAHQDREEEAEFKAGKV